MPLPPFEKACLTSLGPPPSGQCRSQVLGPGMSADQTNKKKKQIQPRSASGKGSNYGPLPHGHLNPLTPSPRSQRPPHGAPPRQKDWWDAALGKPMSDSFWTPPRYQEVAPTQWLEYPAPRFIPRSETTLDSVRLVWHLFAL